MGIVDLPALRNGPGPRSHPAQGPEAGRLEELRRVHQQRPLLAPVSPEITSCRLRSPQIDLLLSMSNMDSSHQSNSYSFHLLDGLICHQLVFALYVPSASSPCRSRRIEGLHSVEIMTRWAELQPPSPGLATAGRETANRLSS